MHHVINSQQRTVMSPYGISMKYKFQNVDKPLHEKYLPQIDSHLSFK